MRLLGPTRRVTLLAACCALLLAPACGGSKSRTPPVLLVGVDGFEWDVALPLLREGRMPHLAALMERGTFGLLETIQPTISPVIWTSIATGKEPAQHGILDFVKPRAAADAPLELFTNADRRAKAVWNVASDAGRRVGVVGWWMTFPVEPVHGAMVAQTNTVDQVDTRGGRHAWKGTLLRGAHGQLHPPELEPRVWEIIDRVEAGLPALEREIFGERTAPLSELARRLWENCRWAFRADAVYAEVAEQLLAEDSGWDLFAVYLGGPDVVGHRFWRWRDPELYADPPPAGEVADLGATIDEYYVYVDGVLGRLVAAAPAGARVLVVADHGMRPVNTGRRFDAGSPTGGVNSAHHLDAPPGIVVAAGPGIARRSGGPGPRDLERADLPVLAGVLDLAPSVLALLDLPAGADMPGLVAPGLVDAAWLAEHPPRRVRSHDTAAWRRAHAALRAEDPGEAERIRQLRNLGYVGGG